MTRRRKQNIKLALVCAILGAIVLMTIFAPWLAPYDPLEVNMELRLLDPCRAHPLGTDALGRDVLSRVIYGGRASLLLAVAAVNFKADQTLVGTAMNLLGTAAATVFVKARPRAGTARTADKKSQGHPLALLISLLKKYCSVSVVRPQI